MLRFNGGEAWNTLDWIAQQAIGSVALEFMTAQRTLQMAVIGTPEHRAAEHCVQRLEAFFVDILQGALPEFFGPTAVERIPAIIGPVCRECGCSHEDACEGGCAWAEVDLCTACSPAAGGRLPAGQSPAAKRS